MKRAMVFTTMFASTLAFAINSNNANITNAACGKEVSLPLVILPIAKNEVSEKFKNWAPGVWSGMWKGSSGSLCHVLVIQKITEAGETNIIYATGKPYFEHGIFNGIIREKDTIQVLEVTLRNGTTVQYKLNKDGNITGLFGLSTTGEFSQIQD